MNKETNNIHQRLTIRVGRGTLSFSTGMTASEETPVVYEPYTVKGGISMAANLREALKTANLPAEGFKRAMVMIDTPVLMVPGDMFVEDEAEDLYNHAFTRKEADTVLYNVLPDLNAVAVFPINKDLKMVVNDNFEDVKFVCSMAPVWRYLHRRSFTGSRSKLYGYFHDKHLDIFSFTQNRFKFFNTFDASQAHDSLYFLLYVWKQLMLRPEHDELHIVGDIPNRDWVLSELKKYLRRAYVINPEADFNNAPATQVEGLPYDLMTLYIRGR